MCNVWRDATSHTRAVPSSLAEMMELPSLEHRTLTSFFELDEHLIGRMSASDKKKLTAAMQKHMMSPKLRSRSETAKQAREAEHQADRALPKSTTFRSPKRGADDLGERRLDVGLDLERGGRGGVALHGLAVGADELKSYGLSLSAMGRTCNIDKYKDTPNDGWLAYTPTATTAAGIVEDLDLLLTSGRLSSHSKAIIEGAYDGTDFKADNADDGEGDGEGDGDGD